MPNKTQTNYDLIVIGGGPAGMMAAGRVAERGGRVLLLEKNPILGKKLLITGGGRCNLTNAEFDVRTLLSHYKESGKFLFSTFATFGVSETLEFFNQRGMETKIENHNRVFPTSDSSASVHKVLTSYLAEGKVKIQTNAEVKKIEAKDSKITGIIMNDGTKLTAHNYLIATGGKSRPETGSTGDGFTWLSQLGHTVIEPDPSLVPLSVKESWIKDLAGLTLPEVKISFYQNDKKALSKNGRLLFTHVGLSGPTILNLSKAVGELLDYGAVVVSIDLFPKEDHGTLDNSLLILFTENKNKQFKNALHPFLPASLAKLIANQSGIDLETMCNGITKDERKVLGQLLKDWRLSIKGLLGTDKAIVTSGGVDLTEVNFKTMQSRKFANLYLVGDILNIDRPSGGYSLQLCWSTGYVAGNSIPLSPK